MSPKIPGILFLSIKSLQDKRPSARYSARDTPEIGSSIPVRELSYLESRWKRKNSGKRKTEFLTVLYPYPAPIAWRIATEYRSFVTRGKRLVWNATNSQYPSRTVINWPPDPAFTAFQRDKLTYCTRRNPINIVCSRNSETLIISQSKRLIVRTGRSDPEPAHSVLIQQKVEFSIVITVTEEMLLPRYC